MGSFVFLFSQSAQMIKNVKKEDKKNEEKLKSLLGGKGFHLAKMISMGLPVPMGFTITTEACRLYYENNRELKSEVITEINNAIKELEVVSQKQFSPKIHQEKKDINPLLVSVRSGAKDSMPGMMDTILNLGFNDFNANLLENVSKDKKFVNDSYLKFIQMFADVVDGMPKSEFKLKLSSIEDCKSNYKNYTKKNFPEDPYEQLHLAIKAVFDSWESPRAKFYRKMHSINDDLGTAVNVQMMVFGNYGFDSGTGVAFSRNPITGDNSIFGEYLLNAQGEDIVSGQNTPDPIKLLAKKMPNVYKELEETSKILETEYQDMQDMEFTIEKGKFYMLQTRTAKRSAKAAVKIAVDLKKEGKITKEEAIMRVLPEQIDKLMHLDFDDKSLKDANLLCKGLPASPGAGVGMVVFDAMAAKIKANNHEKVILVRHETCPEDIEGMEAACGILTSCGGMTSHAAVVARGMGKCCIVGCDQIEIHDGYFIIKNNLDSNGTIIKNGDLISLDGTTGNVYLGSVKMSDKKSSNELDTFMSWVDDIKDTLKVYANADNVDDVSRSLELGAKGIGLCRTEHMFFKEERIKIIRKMILSKSDIQRKQALDDLLVFQRNDFEKMFLKTKNLPLVIRLLDPPLHEFLPETEELQIPIARDFNISLEELKNIILSIREVNPMMGHRGCRLFISYPDIAKMQVEAIISAAINIKKENPNINLVPQIMIPLIGDEEELKFIKKIIDEVANLLILESGIHVDFEVGTMIEIPRAALLADKLSPHTHFFSFGTNDLTQMTFGFSRDDASKFLKYYYKNKIYKRDPFIHIDIDGVGELIKNSIKLGKNKNKKLKIGICGEHGGDPFSINFFSKLDIDYISCSAFRVPAAKLVCARVKILENQ